MLRCSAVLSICCEIPLSMYLIRISKKLASDFKAVYKAPTEEAALSELEGVKKIWGKKYPYALNSWEQN